MTTFGELKVGERFHFGVDADGYEPYMYKVSDTEGYVEHGSGAGLREIIKPDTQVVVWGEPVTLHDHPTEVERAAFSVMLVSGKPLSDHPGLTRWVLAMAENPMEMRDIDAFIFQETVSVGYARTPDEESRLPRKPLREICANAGFVVPKHELDYAVFKAICDYKPKGDRSRTSDIDEERWREYERATLLLGYAIVQYRLAGRPDGDQSHTVNGIGGPLLSVKTSLAAAIAEYHASIMNILCTERLRFG